MAVITISSERHHIWSRNVNHQDRLSKTSHLHLGAEKVIASAKLFGNFPVSKWQAPTTQANPSIFKSS
jgi:hypothetical protein